MIAIITNVTCPCGCCGEKVEKCLKKHYNGVFSIEKDRVIFDNDPVQDVIDKVNAEMGTLKHQLITGKNVTYIELTERALEEMLDSIEKRDVQELTPKGEIKNVQELVHDKTGRSYDRMERIYKGIMKKSIIHRYLEMKVEKTEQLIIDGLGPKEIMIRLNYCNISYLSKQFRYVTGKSLKDFIQEQEMQKNI